MSKIISPWEVVVIGGGLAGSAAATALAKAGRNVLLLEKEPNAHDKVCGEFISFEAQHYLDELGLDLKSMGAASIKNVRLIVGAKKVTAKLPFEALSLSRHALDDALLSQAEATGAVVRRGVMVVSLQKESELWRIKCSGAEDVVAKTVFLATGKHDLRGWQRIHTTQTDFIGFKMHFWLTQSQMTTLAAHVEVNLFKGGYAGLEPIEDGKANLCLVVTKQQYSRYGKSWDCLLSKIMEASSLLADRLRGAEPCWSRPLSIFGIPYGYVYRSAHDVSQNLFRLGDQMAVIPSFSGDGMSIAMHTAALAVNYYLTGDAIAYHQNAIGDLKPLVRRAALMSKWVQSPLAHKIFLSACRVQPQLLTSLAVHTRITNVL